MTNQPSPLTATAIARNELRARIAARFPVILVQSHEELNVIARIVEAAPKADVLVWTLSDGLRFERPVNFTSDGDGPKRVWHRTGGGQITAAKLQTCIDPNTLLRTIRQWAVETGAKDERNDEPAIFVLCGLWSILVNAQGETTSQPVARLVKDLAIELPRTGFNSVVVIDSNARVPGQLEKDITVMNWPLPDEAERVAIIERAAAEAEENGFDVKLNGSREALNSALAGLTETEAENAIAYGLARTGEFGHGLVPIVVGEKEQIIKKMYGTGVKFIARNRGLDDLGGHDQMRHAISRLRLSYSRRAKEFGVKPQSGWLLIGPPGTGKTLTAQIVAGDDFTIIQADMSQLKNSFIGESERNFRRLFDMALACGRTILLLDEIGRMFSNVGQHRDSGVTDAALSQLLGFMTSQDQVLVVATANNPTGLPGELISRFSRIWLVDLPGERERQAILNIHARRSNLALSDADVAALAREMQGYVGREIERACTEARLHALESGDTSVGAVHVRTAMLDIRPTASIRPDEIAAMRKWGVELGTPASSESEFAQVQAKAQQAPVSTAKRQMRRDGLN